MRRGRTRLALAGGGASWVHAPAKFLRGCARRAAAAEPGNTATSARRAAAPAPAQQQQPDSSAPPQQQAPPAPDNTHAIKAQTNEVRVDVVVTDKKGNYLTDLTQKDFKVYEDNKEQPVNTFSFGGDPAAPVKNVRHYLVLFFDTTSMEVSDQPRARAAAAKFIEAHAGPDQVMSVMNFGGSLQVVQNFTTDADRLKQAVTGISNANVTSAVNSSAGADLQQYPGMGNFGNSEVSLSPTPCCSRFATWPRIWPRSRAEKA